MWGNDLLGVLRSPRDFFKLRHLKQEFLFASIVINHLKGQN